MRILGIFGVAYDHVDVDIGQGNNRVSKDRDRFGPVGGIELSWQMISRLALFARGTFAVLPSDSTSGQAEIGLDVMLNQAFSIVGGYRYWRYRLEEVTSASDNDIDLETEGVFVGLHVRF